MKPNHLKWPYSWEERRPLIQDRVLYVPVFYQDHQKWEMPLWEDPLLFGTKGRVFIEYCSGNGSWIVEKAKQFPQDHFVAVEKKFERARKIWSKVKNARLSNLFTVCGEALTFTRYYLRDNCAEAIYVNFPDPWPKSKHAKNRLFQNAFTKEISRIVKNEGTAIVVTDDANYADQVVASMLEKGLWRSKYSKPYFAEEWSDYGTSYFEDLWRKQGRTIRYMQFVNCKEEMREFC